MLPPEEPRSRAGLSVGANMAAALRSAGVLLRDRRKWGVAAAAEAGTAGSGHRSPGAWGTSRTGGGGRRGAEKGSGKGASPGRSERRATWVTQGP